MLRRTARLASVAVKADSTRKVLTRPYFLPRDLAHTTGKYTFPIRPFEFKFDFPSPNLFNETRNGITSPVTAIAQKTNTRRVDLDSDTPLSLIAAALEAIPPLTETQGTGFAWTVYTGDLVAHDADNQLSRLASFFSCLSPHCAPRTACRNLGAFRIEHVTDGLC